VGRFLFSFLFICIGFCPAVIAGDFTRHFWGEMEVVHQPNGLAMSHPEFSGENYLVNLRVGSRRTSGALRIQSPELVFGNEWVAMVLAALGVQDPLHYVRLVKRGENGLPAGPEVDWFPASIVTMPSLEPAPQSLSPIALADRVILSAVAYVLGLKAPRYGFARDISSREGHFVLLDSGPVGDFSSTAPFADFPKDHFLSLDSAQWKLVTNRLQYRLGRLEALTLDDINSLGKAWLDLEARSAPSYAPLEINRRRRNVRDHLEKQLSAWGCPSDLMPSRKVTARPPLIRLPRYGFNGAGVPDVVDLLWNATHEIDPGARAAYAPRLTRAMNLRQFNPAAEAIGRAQVQASDRLTVYSYVGPYDEFQGIAPGLIPVPPSLKVGVVISGNDHESRRINELSRRSGAEVLDLSKLLGMRMSKDIEINDAIADEIMAWVDSHRFSDVLLVELNAAPLEARLARRGIPHRIIDHHININELNTGRPVVINRWQPRSAIQQVADYFGIHLTLFDELVSANDQGGWSTKMLELGLSLEQAIDILGEPVDAKEMLFSRVFETLDGVAPQATEFGELLVLGGNALRTYGVEAYVSRRDYVRKSQLPPESYRPTNYLLLRRGRLYFSGSPALGAKLYSLLAPHATVGSSYVQGGTSENAYFIFQSFPLSLRNLRLVIAKYAPDRSTEKLPFWVRRPILSTQPTCGVDRAMDLLSRGRAPRSELLGALTCLFLNPGPNVKVALVNVVERELRASSIDWTFLQRAVSALSEMLDRDDQRWLQQTRLAIRERVGNSPAGWEVLLTTEELLELVLLGPVGSRCARPVLRAAVVPMIIRQ
jgi:hypothetical protein